ncbi:MAG: hypothetical protein CO095_08970 [Armatimonadetes bacterium CG_4_9_14_3_um_filter_58_7]|nr:MAG: hypothetical protein CO095_08970 [Armatimonadetes bacterium CG_4_9_14_3_um_filter_58_7]
MRGAKVGTASLDVSPIPGKVDAMNSRTLVIASLVCAVAHCHTCAAQEAGKPLSYLVLTGSVRDGAPESPLHVAQWVMADRRYNVRLQKLGFTEGVADITSELTLDYLKQFNVVVCLGPVGAGGDVPSSGKLASMVGEKAKLLLQYAQEGGGLLVMRSPGYQFGTDITAFNQWLTPCGIEILSEQVRDEDSWYSVESGGNKLYWTDSIAESPVTQGVKGIFYPDTFSVYESEHYTDFTSPIRADNNWKVLVRGRKASKSIATQKGKAKLPAGPGVYDSNPPLLAVRDYGKGRIAVWPIAATCVWQDGYHPFWGRGLLMEGQVQGMRGDAAQLLDNIFVHLSEPSKGRFGGFMPQKQEQPKESGFVQIDWDKTVPQGASMPNCYRGLIGARSSLSSGKGKPEEFVQAAKQAGYQFLAFTEELARLTPEKFQQLQGFCVKTSDASFRAYAGFTYEDESGNSWATFGPTLKYPDKNWRSEKYPDRLAGNNALSRSCNWPPVILLTPHHNPEPPWLQGNYKVMSVYTYENGKLMDDALDLYLRAERDRFTLAPVAVHLVDSPAAVGHARATGYQTYIRWFDDNVAEALSGTYGMFKGRYIWYRSSFVSEGPILEDAQIVNMGTSDLTLPGCDKIRVHVRAASTEGLKEVAVLDADAPRPWRRFLPGGSREFDKNIDAYHDHEYNLILTATDTAGKQAFGWVCWTNVQENMFPRCSDNFNTMPRGKWFATPKEMQNPRGFECYSATRNFSYFGLAAFGVPDTTRSAVEYYPYHVSRFASMIDCNMERHYPETATPNPDVTDQRECAIPNEFVTGKARHTMFTGWSDGPLAELVEGDFTVKKEFALKHAPVLRANSVAGERLAFQVTREGASAYSFLLTPKTPSSSGRLVLYGATALYPQPFYGALGSIALQEGLGYIVHGGGTRYGSFGLTLGDGTPRVMKPGDKIAYRYIAVISQLDAPTDCRFVTDIRDKMGLGSPPAYRVTPAVGSVEDTCFTLTVQAKDHGFAGRITEARLPIQLPTRVQGLNPRWDAGIWYKGKVTRLISEWLVNEVGERYVERRQRQEADPLLHIPVLADGTGILQIDTDFGDKDIFVGNLLVCDNAELCLTLTDTRPGKAAFVAHNPTDELIACTVKPAPGFTHVGSFAKAVEVPAGSSVEVSIP